MTDTDFDDPTANADIEREFAMAGAPETPVAVNKDGSVRKKPGPKPGTARRPKSAPAPSLRPATAARNKPSSGTNYVPAILGVAQVPQLGLGMLARFVKAEETRTALILNGMAIGVHAPNIAHALNETAKTDRKLAAILDKLSTVGPYSLVISAVLPLGAQILANHGIIPANPQMGVMSQDELVQAAMAAAG